MVAPSPFAAESSCGSPTENDELNASCAEPAGGTREGGIWMGRNKCFVLESFATVDDGAGSEHIKDMQRRWNKAVDAFLFLLHYKKQTPSYSGNGGRDYDEADAASRLKAAWYEKLKDLHTDPQTRHYHTLVHLAEMLGFLDMLLPSAPAEPAGGVLSPEVFAKQSAAPIRAILEAVSAMATFFHDAVYDATSSTNEEDSAELFREFATELKALAEHGSDDATPRPCALFDLAVDWVGRYILSTKSHSDTINGENGDDDNGVRTSKGVLNHLTRYFSRHMLAFLDADMAVLAKESAAYDAYAGLIRKEYIHVPRDVYCEKRAEVLESFLVDSISGNAKFVFATDFMRRSYEVKAKENLRKEIALLRSGVIPCEDEDYGGYENKIEGVVVNNNNSEDDKEDGALAAPDENKEQEDAIVTEKTDVSNEVAPGWEALRDPNSGSEYYYNSQTGETAWDKPVIQQQELPASVIDDSNPVAVSDAVEEPSEEAVASDSNAENPFTDTTADSPTRRPDGGDKEVVEPILEDTVNEDVLPRGWSEVFDNGKVCYYNAETGETSWTRPTNSGFAADEVAVNKSYDSSHEHSVKEEEPGEKLSKEEKPLPDGWTSLTDEFSGRVYFYNEGTGETSWDKPVGSVAEGNVDYLAQNFSSGSVILPSEVTPTIDAADLFAQPPIVNDTKVSTTDAFAQPPPGVDIPTTGATEIPPDDTDQTNDEEISPNIGDDISVDPVSDNTAGDDKVDPFTEEPPSPIDDNTGVEVNAADVFAASSPTDDILVGEPAMLPSGPDLVNDASVEGEKERIDDASPDVPPLPVGWAELFDESSGRVYFYNEESGTTSWDRPSTSSSGPDIVEESSPSNDLSADEGGESEIGSLEDVPTADDDYAPVEGRDGVEDTSPGAMLDGLNVQPPNQEQEHLLPEGWEQLVDPTSGTPYYYCKTDGTTSWERPTA